MAEMIRKRDMPPPPGKYQGKGPKKPVAPPRRTAAVDAKIKAKWTKPEVVQDHPVLPFEFKPGFVEEMGTREVLGVEHRWYPNPGGWGGSWIGPDGESDAGRLTTEYFNRAPDKPAEEYERE